MLSQLQKYKIILASSSPRRRELFKLIYDNFIVIPPNIDEPEITGKPNEVVMKLSELKANALKNNFDSIIIAADTLVFLDNIKLGKPANKKDAYRILKNLSNNRHEVFTGVSVLNTKKNILVSGYERTVVHFAELSDEEINEYILTNEPFDKAGGYGIQGFAARFINSIEGCYYNVVGLPIRLTYKLIQNVI